MKTHLKYIGMMAFALLTFNIANAQDQNLTETNFIHDISYYTAEYQKSKVVSQKLESLHIHLAYIGVNREFDMDQVKKSHRFNLASVLNIFKKNNVKKEDPEIEYSRTISMEKNPDDAVYYNDVIHN
jgi:hypothetical protein